MVVVVVVVLVVLCSGRSVCVVVVVVVVLSRSRAPRRKVRPSCSSWASGVAAGGGGGAAAGLLGACALAGISVAPFHRPMASVATMLLCWVLSSPGSRVLVWPSGSSCAGARGRSWRWPRTQFLPPVFSWWVVVGLLH